MLNNKFYSLAVEGTEADIVIYGDITSWPWMESDVSAYNLSKQIAELDVDTINVGINSYGGEVAEGLAIFNALKNHKAKIRTRVDGFACSIASVIFAAGDEREMNESSLLMVHNAWTFASGNAADLRKAADDVEKINEASVKAYMSVVSISEDEVRGLMDEETFIDPEEALSYGFATSVIGESTDKPSQNAKRKVFQMLVNPYQLENSDDEDEKEEKQANKDENEAENPDDDEEKPEQVDEDEEESENGGNSGDDDQDAEEKPENGEDDDEEDENATQKQMNKFFNAIINM